MSVIASAYLNAVVDYLLGKGAPSAISAVYLDLYNGDPQGAGSSVLSTITGSATRSDVTASLSSASGGASSNSSIITVAASASGSASVSYVALFSAATGGSLVISGPLTTSRSITTSDSVTFAASELDFSLG